MTPDGRLSRPMGHGSGVIPDTAARNRGREGSPSRQPARPADDRDRGYGAFTTPEEPDHRRRDRPSCQG